MVVATPGTDEALFCIIFVTRQKPRCTEWGGRDRDREKILSKFKCVQLTQRLKIGQDNSAWKNKHKHNTPWELHFPVNRPSATSYVG